MNSSPGPTTNTNCAGFAKLAVAANMTGVSAPLVAVTSWAPTVVPSVHMVCASPAASVGTVASLTLPPPPVTAKSTFTPGTGFPNESVTLATMGNGKTAAAVSACASPLSTMSIAGAPGLAVALNVTGVSAPLDAVTSCAPAVVPSVHMVCASPAASVGTVASLTLPPPPVTAKSTFTPGTGFPNESVTLATMGSGNTAPTVSACASPLSIASKAGGAGVAVALNVTGVSVPLDAVTSCAPTVAPSVHVV